MEKEVLEHLQEIACFLKTNLKEDDVKTLKDYAKNPAIIDWEELHTLITSDIAIAEDNANDTCKFKEEFSELHHRLKNNSQKVKHIHNLHIFYLYNIFQP